MNPFAMAAALGGFLILGIALQILLNSVAIWLVANYMIDVGGKVKYWRCLMCAAFLIVVIVLAALCLLIPIPFINFVLAIVVWYKGSIAAIEGSMEIHDGALSILILYLITGWLIGWIIRTVTGVGV